MSQCTTQSLSEDKREEQLNSFFIKIKEDVQRADSFFEDRLVTFEKLVGNCPEVSHVFQRRTNASRNKTKLGGSLSTLPCLGEEADFEQDEETLREHILKLIKSTDFSNTVSILHKFLSFNAVMCIGFTL